jgi:putative oxidoreductase
MRTLRLVGIIGLWSLQVLLAALFVVIGIAKFADPSWARNFARWGYPSGFYMVIGAVEAIGGICLLVPRIATYAAALLGVIMIGASATHLLHNEMHRVAVPLVYLVVLAIIGIARLRSAARPTVLAGRAAPRLDQV